MIQSLLLSTLTLAPNPNSSPMLLTISQKLSQALLPILTLAPNPNSPSMLLNQSPKRSQALLLPIITLTPKTNPPPMWSIKNPKFFQAILFLNQTKKLNETGPAARKKWLAYPTPKTTQWVTMFLNQIKMKIPWLASLKTQFKSLTWEYRIKALIK